MPINVLMPALSPTMTEGKLARWMKKEGDAVKSGQVLCEIETDKATMEVEAVDEGVLTALLVSEGTEGVAVNTPIAELGGGATDVTRSITTVSLAVGSIMPSWRTASRSMRAGARRVSISRRRCRVISSSAARSFCICSMR